MSLRKKIIFSLFISAFIIAILAGFEYVNFIRVRNEMQFLEVTDSVRNKALELRRHEKNYFLFPENATGEAAATHDYLKQLDEATGNVKSGDPEKISNLRNLVTAYGAKFGEIETLLFNITKDFDGRRAQFAPNENVVPLAEAYSRDKPGYVADFLQSVLAVPPNDPQIARLRELDTDINTLRQTGEDMISTSEDLDRIARDEADRGLRQSQIAILVVSPLFLVFGLSALFLISTGVIKRLKTLTVVIEKISERYAPTSRAPREETGHKDEVDTLIDKFNRMNEQLIDWEEELREKNQELLQSKKLAAIGTLAAGVAHELNNPLNNINLSAQVLKKKISQEEPPEVMEMISDIVGQTARVKGIVGNLLEFAREREPQVRGVELKSLVMSAYGLVGKSMATEEIDFILDTEAESVDLQADPDQLERVFVNLFTNAVAAMEGKGQLTVRIEPEKDEVKVYVADTGNGIPKEDQEKVFDPFFTKKDKGTGLGLAIVMNIIKKHGGNIAVISEEGMGTIFEIVLPRS